jgi:elongator complex protein 3
MLNIPPWIRVNRVQRDFPGNYIEGGNKITNLRQVLDNEIEKVSENSKDIRSMEVKYDIKNIHKSRIVRVDYNASSGKEIFLSHKSCTCTFCWKYKLFQIKRQTDRQTNRETDK